MHFYLNRNVERKFTYARAYARLTVRAGFHEVIHRRRHKIPQHRNIAHHCILYTWLHAKLIEVDWIKKIWSFSYYRQFI
jgi:hypothetical protein